MQIFEMLLYVVEVILLIFLLRKSKTIRIQVIGCICIAITVFVMHLIFESFRWQLVTLYISLVGLAITTLLFINKKNANQLIYKITISSSVTFIVISLLLAYAFPIYDMPLTNGDYLIGTESFIIEDESRFEQYGSDDTKYRKIKIQCWYPTDSIDGYEQVPWLEDGIEVSRSLSRDTGLPAFVLNHTTSIFSNSYEEAPISSNLESYPIVVISHGWRGFRNLHTDFAEELASNGYFVVSIDHTYGSVATVFSEDEVALLNLDALPNRETTPDFLDYANQLVNTYALDVVATLDYLELINNSNFGNKLDLTKIGLLGHSTGGGGDVTVALQDDRIDSIIGLDAWVEPIDEVLINQGLTIPSLFLRSGQWETGYNNISLYNLVENNTQTSLLYQIDGTTHYDFTMVYMYSPLTKLIGFTGDIEGEYLNTILETMIVDFFDNTLRQDTYTDIDVSDWEEVQSITDFSIEIE